jgi:transcriptional regulator with XRE-family HTH domain
MNNIFFPKNLSFLRRAKGLNQNTIGELVGKKLAAVSSWEKGASQPSINDLVKISEYFNITPGDMISIDLEDKSHGSPEYLRLVLERLNKDANNTQAIDTLYEVSSMLENLSIEISETSYKIRNAAKALEEKAGTNSTSNDNDDIF